MNYIRIEDIDTRPQVDPNSSLPGPSTLTALSFDLPGRRVSVSQQSEAALSHHFDGATLVVCLALWPKAEELRAFLSRPYTQILLKHIADQYSQVSPGLGVLSGEALEAWSELLEFLESELESYWSLCRAEEWLRTWADYSLRPDTTDEEILGFVEILERIHTQLGVVVDGDIGEYLTRCRDELRQA